MVGDTSGYRIAVAGVALALVFFAVAAGVILATGHDPTQSFWTVASGLAGALIGILAPSPSGVKGGAAGKAALRAHTAASVAASQIATERFAQADEARKNNDQAAANTAVDQANQATQTAKSHADAAASLQKVPWSIAVPTLLLIAVICELVLFIRPTNLTADLTKQLQAFAAAAAGGAIGLLAPSPTTSSQPAAS
jgi:hypothetical protein